MARDTFRFLVVFGIVFLAFSSGISELYAPYIFGKQCSCNNTDLCYDNSFGNISENRKENSTILPPCITCNNFTDPDSENLQTFGEISVALYWTMFGYGNPQEWYTIENCPENHVLEEFTAAILIGIYHFIAIIVLVNMLIAMMSNSFEKTHDDAEKEWKFHRTKIWLKFIRNQINRPVPMNLFPRWSTIKMLWKQSTKWLCRKGIQKRSPDSALSNPSEDIGPLRQIFKSGMVPRLLEPETKRYNEVLKLIVVRYVKEKVLNGKMVV